MYVAFRHKIKLVAVFLAVLSAVTLYTFLSQEIYRSEAKVLIRLGRENLSVDPSVSGPTLYPSRNRENEVNSELAILGSRAIAEEVVDALGVEAFLEKPDEAVEVNPPVAAMKDAQQELRAIRREVRDTQESGAGLLVALDISTPLSPREKAIKTVMENTSVSVEAKTDIIAVHYDAPSRSLAQRTLASLLDRYLEHHIRVHATQAPPGFFEEQTERYRTHLEASEAKLAAFRKENGISSMEQQKAVLLDQISSLEIQFTDTKAQVTAAKERVASMSKALEGRSPTMELSRTTGRTNYAADAMKERVVELRLKETDLAARYPAAHRPLVEIRQQLAEAEAALAKEEETHTEITTGVDSSYQELQLALENEQAHAAALEARLHVQEADMNEQKTALTTLAGLEHDLGELEREAELAARDYEEYRGSLQRARISNAMDIDKVSNVSLVQPATMPMGPVKPNKLMNLALGGFLALFTAISFAFTVEYFDDSVNAPEHIEKWVGVPVLVTVSDKEYKACI